MTRRARILCAALVGPLVVVTLVAVAADFFLFRYAEQYYREMNSIRLDPLDLGAFPDQPTAVPGSRLAVFYGDSRAADWPAPEIDGLTFLNRGIGGQTSAQVTGRFDAHIRPLQPDILIVQMCINDLKTIPLFPEREADIIAGCLANTRQVVVAAREMGTVVILTTVFPAGNASLERQVFFWSDAVATSVLTVNAALREMAGAGVIVLDAYGLLADDSGLMRPEYAADTLHLNPAGYGVLNTALVEILPTYR